MKFLFAQLSYFLHEREVRRNLGSLLNYLAFVVAVIEAGLAEPGAAIRRSPHDQLGVLSPATGSFL